MWLKTVVDTVIENGKVYVLLYNGENSQYEFCRSSKDGFGNPICTLDRYPSDSEEMAGEVLRCIGSIPDMDDNHALRLLLAQTEIVDMQMVWKLNKAKWQEDLFRNIQEENWKEYYGRIWR